MTISDTDRLWFDAVLSPHRSLGPRAFALLMIAVAVISFVSGMLFLMLGAWPVMGFFGLDALLIWFAFRANYRAARAFERVRLTDRDFTVDRVDAKGRHRHYRFEPSWARIQVDIRDEDDNQICVTSHGRRFVFAECLSAAERLDLADALRVAFTERRDNMVTAAP
ncbi:DUF2244 domain-containing protein [Zavarzinia compransoris]|uniref:DUF2244 domain-containing protein n=1 Tax=Zavarzinia marina TaxID=2911065 RepID=UPI001F3707A0|nr:DUF2244 domain-containing protein [Zavarzinia marina]MCF4166863.1 DUF2244 domain-containing protein [Zavarzinia marina]